MGFSRGPKIVTDGLVMMVDAQSKKSYSGSGTSVINLNASQDNGTLTNGPTFNSNGYWDFDGTNDYMSFGASASSLVQGKTLVSMGILFKLDATASLRGLIGTLNYGCGANLGLVAHNTSLNFYNDTGACFSVNIGNFVEIGKWSFAVGTYDGTTTRLYGIKDGNLSQVSSTTKSGATNTFSSTFRVMGNQYSSYFTNGQCAQSFVYHKVLTQDEIVNHYNNLKLRYQL
jgi:hypothetical protein